MFSQIITSIRNWNFNWNFNWIGVSLNSGLTTDEHLTKIKPLEPHPEITPKFTSFRNFPETEQKCEVRSQGYYCVKLSTQIQKQIQKTKLPEN